jgi:hypothetical protein
VTFSKISLSECVASAVTVPAACKVKPAGEDRNAPQDFLLGLSKQAIAPIERGTHRVMSWQGRASAARQQPHSVVEAISEPLNSIKRRRGLLQTRSQAEFRPIFTAQRRQNPHARRPPERVVGQSRSGLDYMLAVVKHRQHLPPYASVVTTTESEVTEIIET